MMNCAGAVPLSLDDRLGKTSRWVLSASSDHTCRPMNGTTSCVRGIKMHHTIALHSAMAHGVI